MTARPRIICLGYSGNALEMFEHLDSAFRVMAFLDDNPDLAGHSFQGVPVLPMSALDRFADAQVVVTYGSQRSIGVRAANVARLGISRDRFATVVHPAAHVSGFAQIGAGTMIFPGAVVTFNACIGDHCMILPGSVVHHDVQLGDHVLVGSNVTIAGHCRVDQGCYLGSASSFRNGVRVGAGSVIGMAANVIGDVPPGSVMIGNPARPLKPR
ncbi:NeuD/PglB/VioB family sugar acetyltransferase [Paracoccus sp. R86501]|uniref:NeuD/PglB/VioB family sugar acetyltransferase n=1 Tax=Paracoccus sp. R86501 TaxID=3101711 RepID=UPI00366D0514